MKDKINEALEGYQELKEKVDENPEQARESFIDILTHPMWGVIGQSFDEAVEEVENLDLETEEGINRFKDLVDQMQEKLEV